MDHILRAIDIGTVSRSKRLNRKISNLTTQEKRLFDLWNDQNAVVSGHTLKKRSTQEYPSRSASVIAMQDVECKRLSRELHDSVGQLLSLLSLQADQALNKLHDSQLADKLSDEIKCLEQVPVIAKEVLDEVRNICRKIHPSILDDLGVLKAIKWQCRRFKELSDIDVSANFNMEEASIPEILKAPIYRIVQEALSNAMRHSGAESVTVNVKCDNDLLHLTIVDNGRGIEPRKPIPEGSKLNHGGIGQLSMRERTEAFGGNFMIMSNEDRGCEVRASWALSSPCLIN